MTALVISRREDSTADRVMLELHRHGAHAVRLDMADFPYSAGMTAHLGGSGWDGLLRAGSRELKLREVTGVYYRRPTAPRPPGTGCVAEFLADEILAGFGGVLMTIPEQLWLGHPRHISAVGQSKPWQLATARACGLLTPATLVTGDSDQALRFAEDHTAVAVKTFTLPSLPGPHGEAQTIYARRVSAADLEHASLGGIAHQLQQWIEGYGVRVAVVDGQLFATAIHAGSAAAEIDWRADYGSHLYRRVEAPTKVAMSVRELMDRLHLRYGAIDFQVDEAGRWWFLEINANGQWGWIPEVEDEIASAIARALTHAPALVGAAR